jgi:flagellar biosynthetic protein FliR
MATMTSELMHDQVLLSGVMLLSIRFACIVALAPPLGGTVVPMTIRILMAFFCAVFLVPMQGEALPLYAALEAQPWHLALAAVRELTLGAMLGLGLHLGFAMFGFGARLLDVQIGYGMGQVIDPMTRQQLPVLSGAMAQLAIVMFIAADGHQAVVRGLSLSVEHFPPGYDWWHAQSVSALMHQAGSVFSLGFAMVAPVVACLVLVDLTLGLLARNLPQMNVFALGVPLKVVVGLSALAAWLVLSGPVVRRVHGSVFSGWELLLS